MTRAVLVFTFSRFSFTVSAELIKGALQVRTAGTAGARRRCFVVTCFFSPCSCHGCVMCRVVTNSCHQYKLKPRGPARMPTRTLRITTRKSPCGEGELARSWLLRFASNARCRNEHMGYVRAPHSQARHRLVRPGNVVFLRCFCRSLIVTLVSAGGRRQEHHVDFN